MILIQGDSYVLAAQNCRHDSSAVHTSDNRDYARAKLRSSAFKLKLQLSQHIRVRNGQLFAVNFAFVPTTDRVSGLNLILFSFYT